MVWKLTLDIFRYTQIIGSQENTALSMQRTLTIPNIIGIYIIRVYNYFQFVNIVYFPYPYTNHISGVKYSIIYAENDPLHGYIKYHTNIVVIQYNGDKSFSFENGMIDLRGDNEGIYYDHLEHPA